MSRHEEAVHYVVTVKVEKVVHGQRELAEVYRDSGRQTGIKKREDFREVSTVANFNISEPTISRVVDKAIKHLQLVDEGEDVAVDSGYSYSTFAPGVGGNPNQGGVAYARPVKDNPQA